MASQPPGVAGTGLGLKQYTKDVPPGWRPLSYPFTEYREYLRIWAHLTSLDPTEAKYGAAILSRLEGAALRIGTSLQIVRINATTLVQETHVGVDAVVLPPRAAFVDMQGTQHPAEMAGWQVLMNRLEVVYALDVQDLSWTTLDKFFSFRQPHDMDVTSYFV